MTRHPRPSRRPRPRPSAAARRGLARLLAGAAVLLLAGCPADSPTGEDGATADLAADQRTPADARSDDKTPPAGDGRADGPLLPPVSAHELWLTPNIGSADLHALFDTPTRWTYARGKLQVFELYAAQVSAGPCPSCGPNLLTALVAAQAFSKLKSWGVELGLEVGALKEWGCSASVHSKITLDAMANVAANGGAVTVLSMDEPYIGGEHTVNGKSCGYTMQKSAQQTVDYIAQVRAVHPTVRIGDIEPYPYFSAVQLEAWIAELEKRGAKLDFFHLDVDRRNPRFGKASSAADLRRLRAFCSARGIPFGVIFWGQDATSDKAYFDDAIDWLKHVKGAIGLPEHTIFQSWTQGADGRQTVPNNLPEDDAQIFSHTRLLNAGWAELVDNDARRIAQSVPASMKAGAQVAVSITLENSGPLPWTERAGYRLGTTSASWGVGRASLASGERVAPGANKTFSFTVTAPQQAGSYTFEWQMVQEHVEWFGQKSTAVQVSVAP